MKAQINVRKLDETTFEIAVQGEKPTTHVVTVQPEYAKKIGGLASTETLVRASFEFLLSRESNTSILRRFDLPVIGHYFPAFEREIGKRSEEPTSQIQ